MATPLRTALACAAGILVVLGASGSDAQRRGPGSSVWIGATHVDPVLAPLAQGYRIWLRHRLESSGIRPNDEGGEATDLETLGAIAAERGADALVTVELRYRDGDAEILLGLHDPGSREVRGAARAGAPLAQIGLACEDAARQLLSLLGVPGRDVPDAAPPLLDELAATSRALRARSRGDVGRAWHEVAGKLTPTPMRLRQEIADRAWSPDTPLATRARLLAATGDADGAWRILASEAADALEAERPDTQVLLAAGEVLLARNDPRAARPFFEALLARAPRNADGLLGLARVLALQGEGDAARATLLRAAEIDPTDARPLALLVEIESGRPGAQARAYLEAGRRAAQRLEPHRADQFLRQAAQLDPTLAGESLRVRGALRETLGQPEEALDAYSRAAEAGEADAEVWKGIGRSRRALGDPAAEEAFAEALARDADDAEALGGLGAIYAETGRPEEALPLLERAVRKSPGDPRARRRFATALRATGQSDLALEVLEDGEDLDSPEVLREIAAIHAERKDFEAARYALLRAIDEAPYDAELHAELAEVYTAEGSSERARHHKGFAELLGDLSQSLLARDEAPVIQGAPSLDELVLGFAAQVRASRQRRVVHLGAREPSDWKALLVAWLHPRAPHTPAIELAVDRALAEAFDLVLLPDLEHPTLDDAIDRLYEFEDDASLRADAIASVNAALGTDAVFLTRVVRRGPPKAHPMSQDPRCAEPDRLDIELRMLSGRDAGLVSILSDVACFPGGLETYGRWNPRAAGVYGALLLLLLAPLVRGWGTVVVRIVLPPRTKGFFSIYVTRNPDQVPQEKDKSTRRRGDRLRRSLRSLSRYQRHMAARETVFRWIPARKGAYAVAVRGPLLHAMNDQIIGHFLESQRTRVARRKVTTLTFDFCPKEVAVEVTVLDGGQPARGTRVAVQGDPSSLRYARDGRAYLYLGKGTYTVLTGAADRVAESRVEIVSLDNAIPLTVDLTDERGLAFSGCPAAVDPFLAGDYATAAAALDEAGDSRAAHLMRGLHHRQRGDAESAAVELEAAGQLEGAAELRAAEGSDLSRSAELYERAGEMARAAETYRATGDTASAARCYETAYDYHNALECYEELGDTEKSIELYEKTGEYLEAARLARRSEDLDRAVWNLQQINRRNTAYAESCRELGEILLERGEPQLAVEKVGEAVEYAGGENAPIALLEFYAGLLDGNGDDELALSMWHAIQRRDPTRDDVAARAAEARRRIAEATRAPTTAPTRLAESRYELLDEIGRGGMGVVFKARDRQLGRVVALKRLPDNLRDHPDAVRLFQREAQAAAALNHRNIVTLFDAGEEGGSYFITMELLEGMTLNAILEKRGTLSPRDVCRLGAQICDGLRYAHDRRIVHRDIKTANLFVTNERIVKIMDFGLAKTIEEVRRNSTVIGGTPYYMAPEQAAGEAVDHRTDLYAVGVTFFRCLTGTVPFRDGDLAYQHRHVPAPDPREIRADIPGDLARLVLKLLEKNPDDRFASAAEIGAELQRIQAATAT